MVQFYCWKASELLNSQFEVEASKVVQLSESQQEKISAFRSLCLKDHELAEMVFSCMTSNENWQSSFDWAKFSAAVAELEDYTCKLHKQLLMSLPSWRTQGIIYSVPFEGF